MCATTAWLETEVAEAQHAEKKRSSVAQPLHQLVIFDMC